MASGSTHRGLGVTAGLDVGLARELAAHSSAGPDRRGGRSPRDRSCEAVARDRLGCASSADRRAPAGGIRASRAPAREATRIMVAAMRPRLCRLGGAIADGVLLNWMLPGQAARARGWVRDGPRSKAARRPSLRPTCGSPWGQGRAGACGRRRPLSHHQRGPPQALRSPGCPCRKRGNRGLAAGRRPRGAGPVPLGARPTDRARPRGRELAQRRYGRGGAITTAIRLRRLRADPPEGGQLTRTAHELPAHLDESGRSYLASVTRSAFTKAP
jgi:hypothetical protein